MRPLLLLLSSLAFFCCSPKPEAPEPPAKSAGPGAVRIVLRQGKGTGHANYVQYLLQRYDRLHPTVDVAVEALPWDTGRQHDIYSVNLKGKSSAFDVMNLDIVWIPEFARKGWLVDLTPYFTEKERKEFLPSAIDAATFDGKLYAIPTFTDCGLLYWRKDLLKKYGYEVPETWDDLVEAAKAVIDGEKDPSLSGFVWQGKESEGGVCAVLEFLASNGVSLVDERGMWVADEEKAAQALGFAADLIHKHKVSPLLVLSTDEETARGVFGNAQALFMRNWPYARAIFSKRASLVRDKFSIAPLPHFEGHESAGVLGGWFLAVNKYSRNPREAVELIRYMTSESVQKSIFERTGFLPTLTNVYRDRELREEYPHLARFEDILARSFPRPVTPLYMEISQKVLQPEFSAVLSQSKSPREAVRDIRKGIERLLGK